MDFFQRLHELVDGVDITIQVKRKDGTLTLGIYPTAIKKVIPLTITGTPEELDADFFDTIANPLQEVKQVVSNADAFKESLKTAEKEEQDEETDDEPAATKSTGSIKKKAVIKKAVKKAAEAKPDKKTAPVKESAEPAAPQEKEGSLF